MPGAGFKQALASPAIWRRATLLGVTVGGLQVMVNQGDVWASQAAAGRLFDPWLLTKALLSPLITFTVSLVSSALELSQRRKETL